MPRAFRPSALVKRLLERGLTVPPSEVEAYRPDATDIAIARAMAEGAFSVDEICQVLHDFTGPLPELSADHVRFRLAEPVRAAWYRLQVLAALPTRVADVYVRVMQKALRGDAEAARIFLTRFDPCFRPTTRRESVSAHFDVRALSDTELDRQLVEKLRKLIPHESGSERAPQPTEPDGADSAAA